MASPCLTIDLDKIEHNARSIVAFCGDHGITVAGVTKGVCGHPEVAKAMLRGGVAAIGDSRLDNIRRLRDGGVTAPCMLLRVPPLSGVETVVTAADVSLNSELSVLSGLSEAAQCQGRIHEVILMVDLGDLREGVWPDDLLLLVRAAAELPGIRIVGLGTNLACLSGVLPSAANMRRLVELAGEVEQVLGRRLAWISGINSSGLELIAAGEMPRRVNHARIGEAILLGRETTRRRAWPGTLQDAFVIEAEVLECKRKPSLPIGERGQDAFGTRPVFEDRGERMRALLDIGREDVQVKALTPLQPGMTILAASSGYLLVDVGDAPEAVMVGARLSFSLDYGALLAAMTSAYVRKRLIRDGRPLA